MNYMMVFLLGLSSLFAQEIVFDTTRSMFGAGEINLECQLKEKHDKCKFDTGANISTISSGSVLLEEENPEVIASTSYTTATGAQKSCDFIKITDIKIGNYLIDELTPVSCNLNPGEKAKNLIGLDAFHQKSFYLDYKSGKIIVNYTPPEDKVLRDFDVDSVGHILIPVRLTDGTSSTAMFDTGASLTVVSNKFINDHEQRFSVLETNNLGQDSFGNPIEMRKTISTLKIEDQSYVAEYIMGIDFKAIHDNAGAHVNFILGHNIISSNNWYFDLKNKKWYVE
jgi:predicted aspartyl protease